MIAISNGMMEEMISVDQVRALGEEFEEPQNDSEALNSEENLESKPEEELQEEKPKKVSEFRQLQEDHNALKVKVDRLQGHVYRAIGPDEENE